MTGLALAALLALGQADAGAAAPAELQSLLHAVRLDSTLEGPVDWSRAEVVLSQRTPEVAAAAFITRRKLAPHDGRYVIGRLTEVLASDAPVPRHRKPSWVIDYDQKAFEPAFGAVKALGTAPTVDQLTAFTAQWVTRKSYDRGFDLASQVATRRGGDCTEHAVFLVALLRHAGIPARAVLGLVLVSLPKGPPRAFGHMWAEAWVDGSWRIADAAIPAELRPVYLPAGELVDEGPGYTMSLMKQLTTLSYERLEVRLPH